MPVAVVAGLFWPRRKFLRYPGDIKVRFLPPIEPGLEPEAFMERLVSATETAVDALLVDAIRENPQLPIGKTARGRFVELTGEEPGNPAA